MTTTCSPSPRTWSHGSRQYTLVPTPGAGFPSAEGPTPFPRRPEPAISGHGRTEILLL